MKKYKFTKIIIIILIVVVILAGYYLLARKDPQPIQTQDQLPQVETSISYNNPQYGFSFSLPVSWKRYSIISQNWNGQIIDSKNNQSIIGPEILIRHPLWTSSVPRQDIPIMIFSFSQWDLIQQEKLSLGAAPIGPSELGRNSNYVFALPARYNFAYPVGFEEVEKIINSKSFRTGI